MSFRQSENIFEQLWCISVVYWFHYIVGYRIGAAGDAAASANFCGV